MPYGRLVGAGSSMLCSCSLLVFQHGGWQCVCELWRIRQGGLGVAVWLVFQALVP